MKKRFNLSQNTVIRETINHFINYPCSVALSYAWSLGSLIGFFFVLQVITGILLGMYYVSDTALAFDSVMHIMRDVNNGWLLRYGHSNGASMIFIFLYLHIGKGLYFSSYKYNRKKIWWSGLAIFVLMMATAFIGYVLPWGQMSLWGATVITNLLTTIPFFGENLVCWIWGGYSVGGPTLTRFFSLHYCLPFIIAALIVTHLALLHEEGSTNPTQSESKNVVTFYPKFFWKDLFALNIALMIYVYFVYINPNYLGHPDNWIKANPLVTPSHIVPEWYFTPFYAILRSCPHKIGGIISMALSLIVLFIVPLIRDRKGTIPSTISPYYKFFFWQFAAVFLMLMFLGGKPAVYPYVILSKVFTILYFVYFLIILPCRGYIEPLFMKTKVQGEIIQTL